MKEDVRYASCKREIENISFDWSCYYPLVLPLCVCRNVGHRLEVVRVFEKTKQKPSNNSGHDRSFCVLVCTFCSARSFCLHFRSLVLSFS